MVRVAKYCDAATKGRDMRSVERRRETYGNSSTGTVASAVDASPILTNTANGHVASLDGTMASLLFGIGRLVDGIIVFLAGMSGNLGNVQSATQDTIFLVAFASLLTVNVLQVARCYSPWAVSGDWRPVVVAPVLLVLCLLAVPGCLIALGEPLPRWPWLIHWSGVGVIWLVLSRLAMLGMAPRLASVARFHRRVLVVGEEERMRAVADLIQSHGVSLSLGQLDRLRETLGEAPVDDVIVALPWADDLRVASTLAVLKEYAVGVHLFPDDPRPFTNGRGVSLLGGVPLLTLSNRPLSGWGSALKAIEDRVVATILLILASPLLVLIAVAIKLDSPGPVLFRQERYGFNNDIFTVFKFRSMYLHGSPEGIEQARRDDPRITWVGRLLRRTSLDELPQLLNVLNGTMSLVGPRPHAVEHQTYYQHLVDEYRCRHRMRPGITGWAQVNGYRGETSTVELMRKRVEYDLYYIEHWSLFFDLWILSLTPFACMRGKNAY